MKAISLNMRNQKRKHKTGIRRARLEFEVLEPRIQLDASLPLFLYEWDINAYEDEWFTPREDRVWEYFAKGESTKLNLEPVRHEYLAEYYDSRASRLFLGNPKGFTEWEISATEASRSTTLSMTYAHDISFASSAMSPFYGSHNRFSAVVSIWILSSAAPSVTGSILTSRKQQSDLGALASNYVTHRFSYTSPVGDEIAKSIDTGFPTGERTKVVDGVTYRLATREFISTGSSIADSDNNCWPSAAINTCGTVASGRLSFDLSVTVEIQDIEPVPRFTGLSTLGLGKTLELDAIGSFDPDQATGDGTGIIAYEWYVQRVDQPGSLEYLGNGVTLKYVYSDSSVLDKLGLYDITLKVTDNEGSMASLTKPLTLTMDFRNVVFHGWSPLPGETLLESHNTFAGYAGRLNELLRTPEFVPQGSTFASFAMNWDSFSGFSYALVSRLAAEAMLVPAPPQGRVAMLTLRQILLWAYRHQHALASRKAEAAAQDAAKFIAEDPGIIPDDPIRTPALHLIGHSRGGYVASRTSQILETNYGLESSYVTLLDGYGDDWPDFAASFADGNILSTATALNGNSFRVQQSLLEIASDPLADAVSKSIHDAANRFLSPSSWLSEVILEIHSLVDDAFRRWVASSEWRAPERAGIFGNNEIIPGSSVTGHSNHINIHELYFGSPATESREAIPASFELLLKSPVGNPAGSIPLSSSGASGEAVFDEPLDLAIDFLSPRFLAELYEIRQLASDNLSVLDGEESWIDVYLHLLATPGYLEEQFFGSADAQIVQLSSGQHGIKLAQASGIQTFVSASTGNGVVELSFVMENLLDGQSAEAQVTLDGNLVASIVIPENGLIKYSLPFSIGQSGIVNLGLEVAIPSSGGFDGKVSLTGVRILGSNPRGDFHASPPFNVIGQSEEIVLRLDDPVSTFGAAISSVVFFLETNNRHGLQDESSPDTVLGEGVREGNDWVLFITESDVHHGRNLVYAKITSEDMRRSIQSISFENFASKSNLTFYSNPFDVNRDGFVTPLDALLVVNHLSRNAGQEVVAVGALLPDVNGSGQVAPLDALMVLNEISRRSRVRPENEQVAEVTRHVPVLSHHEQTSGETLIELSRLDRSQRELTFDSRVLAGIVPDATLYGKNNQGLEPPANNEVLHFQEMRRAELEVLLQRRRGLDGAEVIALLPKDEHPSFLEWSLVDQLLSDIDFLLFDEESELHLSDGVARRA